MLDVSKVDTKKLADVVDKIRNTPTEQALTMKMTAHALRWALSVDFIKTEFGIELNPDEQVALTNLLGNTFTLAGGSVTKLFEEIAKTEVEHYAAIKNDDSTLLSN